MPCWSIRRRGTRTPLPSACSRRRRSMDASSNSLPPEDLSKRGVARCREKEHARVTQSSSSRGTVGRVPFDGNFIEFDGLKIQVLKHIQGDTDENTMLWIPGQRTLIAGDVVVNNMHLYT